MVTEDIALGHKIFAIGLEVDQVKIAVIKTLMPPTTVKNIRSFLQHCDSPNPAPDGVSSEGVTLRDWDSLTFSFSELTPVPVFSFICTISVITKILLHIHYTYHHSGIHYILYTYTLVPLLVLFQFHYNKTIPIPVQ